jgi:hypothetical protein
MYFDVVEVSRESLLMLSVRDATSRSSDRHRGTASSVFVKVIVT